MFPAVSPRRRRTLSASAVAAALLIATGATPAAAWNTVTNTNGDAWSVNDAAIPGLDTGSIHNTSTNSLEGYGGLRMQVQGTHSRLSGILLRGFGEKFDGTDAFASQDTVLVDGIGVQRALLINTSQSWARFFDSFTNTTKSTQTVEVAFGGQLGFNQAPVLSSATPAFNQSAVAATSSGDRTIAPGDAWASVYTPTNDTPPASYNGPSATVIGTAGYAGALTRTGDFLRDPFTVALPTTGDEANHYGYVNRIVIPPKQTRSLVHFVVTGLSEKRPLTTGASVPAAGSQVTAVQSTAASLASTPSLGDLSTGEVCTITNFDLTKINLPGFSPASCPATQGEPLQGPVVGDAAPGATTSSPYDVTGKTITQMEADMASGVTNAQQIMRAYLDRIAAYDQGPLGLHSVITIAPDAMAQAKAADDARAAGDTRPLLGIPILAKDIYDTEDMPTTGGSLVFDGFRPAHDAWLVAKLRDAGALIMGKANLSEFANDGSFSSSAFGQVWNAFDPSKSSIGSSGGSAVAVASSFAAAALGTQTGDSLWGPSSAASLVSLRGTDGMQSTDGVMPLTYIQDYAGVIARSVPDLALLLNATAVGNPSDPLDDVADGHRPTDWTSSLTPDALQGKVIGVPATAFDDPYQTTGTSDAMRAQFAHFTEAGATVKPIPDPPADPNPGFGDTNYEGWYQWIKGHPENPYTEVPSIIRSPLRIPQFRNATPYTGTGPMTDAQIAGFQAYRADYRAKLTQWMDQNGVDAVVFPGELSDIHLNDSIQTSFGRRDPQASAAGVPTSIFPAGVNDHGQPIDLQLEGRPFSDPQMVAYAYAFELKANGHVDPTATTPSLPYQPGVEQTPSSVSPAPAPVSSDAPSEPAPIIEGGTSTAATTPPAATPPTLRLTLLTRRLTADAKGRFRVLVGCASARNPCTGTVEVRRGGKLLAKRTVTVNPGTSRTVTVTPPAKLRRALAHRRKLAFTVKLVGTGATSSVPALKVSARR